MAQSYSNGRDILRFEQSIHLAPEHALNSFFAAVPAVAIPACFLYATCHYLITPTVMIWLWRAHPEQYRRVRSVLVVGTLVALLGFWLLPTAPPRLIGGFSDTMAHWSSVGWWGTAASVPDGLEGLTDQAGAMPSLHVGWALWCGWAVARCAKRRWVRALGIAYPVITILVVIGTANHYLADAVAGAAVIGLGMLVVAVIVRVQARHIAGRLIRSVGVSHRTAPALAAEEIRDLAAETSQSGPENVDSAENADLTEERSCLMARTSPATQRDDRKNGPHRTDR
ncbi:MAG TPA: phosphatase PAP2 family protein [Mycobacteriales bacterium]|jgi:hypothetical protein|nr:phosphatase PAP2 family protein [Mycobacteriales bacterium]